MEDIKKEYFSFKEYCFRNRWGILFFSGLFLLIWGAWIYNTNPRVDTELVINAPNEKMAWDHIGRQGFLFSEAVFGILKYNPFVYTLFGYIFVALSGVLFGYIFWRAGKGKVVSYIPFVLLVFTQPIMAEQFYFDLQIFQVGLAYILTAIAAGLSCYSAHKKSKTAGVVSILLMLWIFSSYQACILIYIASVIVLYILSYRKDIYDNRVRKEECWLKYILLQVILFILGFILNWIITKVWFSGDNYLDNMIAWGRNDLEYQIKGILHLIKGKLTGGGSFFTWIYPVIAFITVCSCMLDLGIDKRRVIHEKLLYVAAIVGLQITPTLLTIYMGQDPPLRGQIAYPFVLGLDMVILLSRRSVYKLTRIIVTLLIVCCTWLQTTTTLRLIYTDIIRAEEDIQVATQIHSYLRSAVANPNKEIAFIGEYRNHLNASCKRGDLIGSSLFSINTGENPKYMVSTMRACGLMKTVGCGFNCIQQDRMMDARVTALNMPSWPDSGCIVDAGDYIVVKFSDDAWPEEVEEYAPGSWDPDLKVNAVNENREMEISLYNHEESKSVRFAVWSEKNGQDDLAWYGAELMSDGTWRHTVDLNSHNTDGLYYIDAYETVDGEIVAIQRRTIDIGQVTQSM